MDYVLADPVFIPESARHLLAEKVYDLPCLITIDPILDVPRRSFRCSATAM